MDGQSILRKVKIHRKEYVDINQQASEKIQLNPVKTDRATKSPSNMENLWQPYSRHSQPQLVDIFKDCRKTFNNPINATRSGCLKSRYLSIAYRKRGHKYGHRNDWYKACFYYTKSLCYAPLTSRFTGVAYAYRSIVFAKTNSHAQALIDIDLALKSACPLWLPTHLKNNRYKYNKIAKPLQTPKEVHIDYPIHALHPVMANVIAINENNEFGRFLCATEDIGVGKVILFEEFFAFGASNAGEFQCETCLRQNVNFIPCQRCSNVVFCNEECQRANRTHQVMCGNGFHELKCSFKLTIQTILLAMNEFSSADELMEFVLHVCNEDAASAAPQTTDFRAKYRFYLKLQQSKGAYNIELAYEIFQIMVKTESVRAYFNSLAKQRFLMHLICQHHLINTLNGFATDDCAMVFVVISILNHSCAPNVLTTTINNRMICRTIRPIRRGEQLFISYFNDLTPSSDKRRKDIEETWNFCCCCEACKPIDNNNPNYLAEVDDKRLQTIVQLLDRTSATQIEIEQWKRLCEDVLNDFGHGPWTAELQTIVQFYANCWTL